MNSSLMVILPYVSLHITELTYDKSVIKLMRSIVTVVVAVCLAMLLASPLCSCWGLLPHISMQRVVHIGRHSLSPPTHRLSCFICHDDTTSCSSIDREGIIIEGDDIHHCNPSTTCSHDLSSSDEKLSGRTTTARTIVLSSIIGLFMMQQTQQPSFGVADRAAGLPSSALEQSVVKLEAASTRAGVTDSY